MRGIMVSDRHSVQRHNFHRLTVKLQVKIAIGRGIQDAPELAFPDSNGNTGTDCAVDGKDFFRYFNLAATAVRSYFQSFQQRSRLRISRDGLSADNQYLFAKIANFRDIAFHTPDYDCAGHAIAHLTVAFAMRMSVVPIQSRRMVLRDGNGVVERLPRHGHHGENVVLWRVRRNLEAVEMKVGQVHARGNGTGTLRFGRQLIEVVDSERVTWRDSQDRRHVAAVECERVATVCVGHRVEREGKLMIARTQFRGFGKAQALVASRGEKYHTTGKSNERGEQQNAVHESNSFNIVRQTRVPPAYPSH